MRSILLTIAALLVIRQSGQGEGPPTSTPTHTRPGQKDVTSVRIPHDIRSVEGWTVHVDRSLLQEDAAPLGPLALRVLANQLFVISLRLPADRLEKLREVPIWLDREHPLTSLQYHPSADWLREHGYDSAMARGVHIPRAHRLVDHTRLHDQPWCMLHELAHAYHHQVLGWEQAAIRQAWQSSVDSGRLESVPHMSGRPRRHYALTNPKEFFAEMTEAFIGTNDFYPFVRGELRDFDPEVYALMQSLWMEGSPETPAAD